MTDTAKAAGRITLLYDIVLRKAACELLQAAFKCDYHHTRIIFKPADWLFQPTPGMRRIVGTRQEWERLAESATAITEKAQ